MPIVPFEDSHPSIDASAFVAENATVIGNVTVGPRASIWYGAVVRGDLEAIVIEEGSNIQDGAVLHADPGDPTRIGPWVTVGHRAVVHGATIEAGALIGIGAVVLNGARVGQGAVIGAGAVVPPGAFIPPGMLALGVPARAVRPVTPPQNARRYAELAKRYKQQGL